jgi:hypothetical protein
MKCCFEEWHHYNLAISLVTNFDVVQVLTMVRVRKLS